MLPHSVLGCGESQVSAPVVHPLALPPRPGLPMPMFLLLCSLGFAETTSVPMADSTSLVTDV